MGKIIVKKIRPTLTCKQLYNCGRQSHMKEVYKFEKFQEQEEAKENAEIIEEKKDSDMMTTNEKIELANAILADSPAIKAKRIKKDKGLIERRENTIILTEDNRELLKD